MQAPAQRDGWQVAVLPGCGVVQHFAAPGFYDWASRFVFFSVFVAVLRSQDRKAGTLICHSAGPFLWATGFLSWCRFCDTGTFYFPLPLFRINPVVSIKNPCLWLLTHMSDANRSVLTWLFSHEENEYSALWINWRCLGACLTWAPRLHLKRFNVQPKRILIMNKSYKIPALVNSVGILLLTSMGSGFHRYYLQKCLREGNVEVVQRALFSVILSDTMG